MREFTPLQQLQRSIWRHRTPISHHPAHGTDTTKTLRVLVHAQILNCISLGQRCCWELDRASGLGLWPCWPRAGRRRGGSGATVDVTAPSSTTPQQMTTRQRRPAPDFQPARPLGGIHPDPLVTGTAVSERLTTAEVGRTRNETENASTRLDPVGYEPSCLSRAEIDKESLPQVAVDQRLLSWSSVFCSRFGGGGGDWRARGRVQLQDKLCPSRRPPPGGGWLVYNLFSFPLLVFQPPKPSRGETRISHKTPLFARCKPTSQRRNRNDGNDEPPIWFPILDPSTHLRHVMSSDELRASSERKSNDGHV